MVIGRVAEHHWDLDQESRGAEQRDAVAAQSDLLDEDVDDPPDV